MKSLVLIIGLAGCTAAADASDHAGTWERQTWAGVEVLELRADGTFSFVAPDVSQLGGDVDHVTGTYVRDGQFLELTGTTGSGGTLDARFTFAVDGDTFVRGAVVRDLDSVTERWFFHYASRTDGLVDVTSWTVTQLDDGTFLRDYASRHGALMPYYSYLSGTWTLHGEQIHFADARGVHVELEMGPDARRVANPNDGLGGLSGRSAQFTSALVYTRAVMLP